MYQSHRQTPQKRKDPFLYKLQNGHRSNSYSYRSWSVNQSLRMYALYAFQKQVTREIDLESCHVYTRILVCDGGYTRIIKKMENDFVCDVIVGDSDFYPFQMSRILLMLNLFLTGGIFEQLR